MPDETAATTAQATTETTAQAAPVKDSAGDRGITMSIPTTADAAVAAPDRPALDAIAPEEYKAKGWFAELLKNEDPIAAMFKSHENLQSKIGQKTLGLEVPGEGATKEQIDSFYKALGRPDVADGYEYTPPDLSKEPEQIQNYFKDANGDAFGKTMKEAAHELGLTPKQFAGLAGKFHEMQIAEVKDLVAGAQALGEQQAQEQRKALTNYYGDKTDSVEKIAKDTAAKVIPKEIAALGTEAALMHALHLLHEKVYKNDSISTANAGAPSESLADIDRQIERHRAATLPGGKLISDSKMSKEYDGWVATLQSLYKRQSEMRQAAKS